MIIQPLVGASGLSICDYYKIQYKVPICNFAMLDTGYVANPAAGSRLSELKIDHKYYIVGVVLEGDTAWTLEMSYTSGGVARTKRVKLWSPYTSTAEYSPPLNYDSAGDPSTTLTLKNVEAVTGTIRAIVVVAW